MDSPSNFRVWEVLTEEQLRGYMEGSQSISYLADALKLPDHQFDARTSIKLDYYSHFMELAVSMAMSLPQMGALLSIAQEILQKCQGDEWQDYNAAIAKAAEAKRLACEQEMKAKWEAEQKELEDIRKAEDERLRLETLKKKPQTLAEAVEHAVAVRLHDEKLALDSQYKAREDELLQKIEQLKQQIQLQS